MEAGVPQTIAPTLAALVGADTERALKMVEDGALDIYESLQELNQKRDIHHTLGLASELGRSAERTELALSLLTIELRDRLAQRHQATTDQLYTSPHGTTDAASLLSTAKELELLRSKLVYNPNRTMSLERIFLHFTGQLTTDILR